MNYQQIKITLFILFLSIGLYACGGSDVGGNEDTTEPVVTLTSLNDGEEVIGTMNITWITAEPNPSSVDIFLSNDSGATFIEIASAIADTGNYQWDSYQNNPFARKDGDNFRVKVIAKDVVGNVSASAESLEDFVINNVPEVAGQALYFDLDNNGPDAGDRIDITFDKDIQLRTPVARDFFLPVLGDAYGTKAQLEFGSFSNKMSIVLDDLPESIHLNIGRKFSPLNVFPTSATGIDIIAGLPEGVIKAVDTGITATPSGGIDIVPTFSSTLSLANNSSSSIKLVDVDGDGDLDMLVGNSNTSNYLWINNTIVKGTGQFGIPGEFVDSGLRLGTLNTMGIAVGDIDGDGDVDLISGNYGAGGNKIWVNENINTGNFVSHPQVFASADIFDVQLGDLDGDGDLDLVAADVAYNQPSTIWFNDPTGDPLVNDIFVKSTQVLEIQDTREVALGDVDGDGDLDIVTSNFYEPNYVWLNDTLHPDGSTGNAGEFIDSTQRLGGSYATASIVLGDIDNDGDLDLVAAGSELYAQVFKNDGSGQFSMFDDQNIPTVDVQGMKLIDVDGDGDKDLVIANDSVGVDVRVNDGMGNFEASHFTFSFDDTWDIAIGDVDKDGDMDIAAANLGNSDADGTWSNRMWLSSTYARQRPHSFVYSEQDVGNSIPEYAIAVDFDKDGDQDLLLGYVLASSELWINNGSGVFTDSGQALSAGNLVKIIHGDLDNDGDEDVIFANSAEPDTVWLNDGNGTLTDSGITIGTTRDTNDIALIDVDGDGDLDVVATYIGLSVVPIWLNDTLHPDGSTGVAATFIDAFNNISTGQAYSVSSGDVDGDGDLDLVFGVSNNFSRPSEKVFINDGLNTGDYVLSTFALPDWWFTNTTNTTRDIALADYDGDGDLDIYSVSDYNGGRGRILINQGKNSGDFSDTFYYHHGEFRPDFSLIDYDLDGDIDYVNGVWMEQPDSYGLGHNNFVFTQVTGTGSPGPHVAADFNGNGFPDTFDGKKIWVNDR